MQKNILSGIRSKSYHLNLKTPRTQWIGLFANFFKKTFERINLKLHKKVLIGLKKLFQKFFKAYHKRFALLGLFLNIKGKLGVTGNAKKRRYFFYFGKHNITRRTLRVDLKHTPI